MQISGYAGELGLDSLEGRIVHTDEDVFGDFECSNPLLNRIHDNVERTLRIALKGFLLDCINRECIGYNEPASVSASLFTRKHLPRFWGKYCEDIRLTASEDGFVADVAPQFPNKPREPDVAQSACYPMLVWYLYQEYDDRRLLDRHYPAVKAWTDYVTNKMCDGPLVVKGWLGDHMQPGDAPGDEKWLSDETPSQLIWTALYYRNLCHVSEMANVLGRSPDPQRYAELAEQVKEAFNKEWLDRETGHYGSKSQTSEILPLAVGLVPDELRPRLLENIAQRITQADKGHLRVGHAGLVGLIESLTEHGLGEILYAIINQRTYPGWGYMVEQGATTIWECWGRDFANRGGRGYRRADSMTMLAGVNRFFYNDLAGIQGPSFYGQETMKPGFKEFRIKPHVLGELTWARASIRTVRGVIRSGWKKDGNSLTLEVTIPAGASAKVSVPTLGLEEVTVTEGGKTVWKDGGYRSTVAEVTGGAESADYVTFDVGSGTYRFELTGSRKSSGQRKR